MSKDDMTVFTGKSQTKILPFLTFLLLAASAIVSLSAAQANALYLFFLLFAILLFLRRFLPENFSSRTRLVGYFLLGIFWAAVLTFALGRLGFHPNPAVNFLIALGFYLPFLSFWYFLVSKFELGFWEIFYLSGFSGVLFSLIVTGELLLPFARKVSLGLALWFFALRILITLVSWGALASLPAFFFLKKESGLEKPLKVYLLATSSSFLALPVFLLWQTVIVNLLLK